MDEDIKMVLDMAKEAMDKAMDHLGKELTKIRAGKANPVMLDGIMVDYYGSATPLNQVGAVSAPDPRLLTVKPWEKSMLGPIEKAIINSNRGFNPSNDGEIIRVPVPSLSEDRRKQLAKQAQGEAENARIGIRAARKSANDYIKSLIKDGLSEDYGKQAEDTVQKMTNQYGDKINDFLKKKEDEIMTV